MWLILNDAFRRKGGKFVFRPWKRITTKFWRVHYDATDEKIRLNYRNLSPMWHPDGHNGDNAVTAKFQQINEAYSGIYRSKCATSVVLLRICIAGDWGAEVSWLVGKFSGNSLHN
ncbi:hypothetical protein RHSIM_Rhsim03G0224000 [Rhododendron simsii]|uniref:J domain-containing protein n=1 Tax=Rhododendron simsii TaxID=118357 RepID=A0A834LPK8_RHOSS|nr:hypothetical protein RHSIM_Rhsim03G0224000 [Rhododendron simsii]